MINTNGPFNISNENPPVNIANIPTTAVKISVLPFKKLSNPYTIGLKSVRSLAGWNPRTYFVSELTLVSFFQSFRC